MYACVSFMENACISDLWSIQLIRDTYLKFDTYSCSNNLRVQEAAKYDGKPMYAYLCRDEINGMTVLLQMKKYCFLTTFLAV